MWVKEEMGCGFMRAANEEVVVGSLVGGAQGWQERRGRREFRKRGGVHEGCKAAVGEMGGERRAKGGSAFVKQYEKARQRATIGSTSPDGSSTQRFADALTTKYPSHAHPCRWQCHELPHQ